MSSRELCILAGCVALTACGRGADQVPPRAATAGEGIQFTMMTFNVHQDEWGDRATVQAVGAPNADIVCLQEPTLAWERALRSRYASQYPHMLFKTDEESGGLAVLSRFPIEDGGLSSISDWHPAWYVVAETPAGRLQILNLHLRAVFDGDHDPISNYFAVDADHLKEIERFAARLAPRTPTVVIGDFNEGENGPALRWLEARGFHDVLPMFHPGQHTWRGRGVVAPLVMSIDHVMYTQPLSPLDAWVAPRGRSDHMPVLARFQVSRPWQE
jgi:endonuclease/exonuclease/phosphatase family metal-dependent hydrolase